MMDLEKLMDFRNLKYDWDEIEKVPEFALLKKAEQNPKWHAEGNAFIHTQNVCEQMVAQIRIKGLDGFTDWVKVLMTAALFHDVGKGTTTALGNDGNWHSYGHEKVGEVITRRMLWNEPCAFREQVCALVRYHMDVFYLLGRNDLFSRIITISHSVKVWHFLLLLAYCDTRGSKQDVNLIKSNIYDLDKLTKIIKEMGCLNKPFGDKKISTFSLFNKNDAEKIFLDSMPNLRTSHVYVLMGLAGAGKSTWIKNHIETECFGKSAVVSRDDIRIKLGYCKEGDKMIGTPKQEATVTEEFAKELRQAAEEGEAVYIDNLNLKRKYRDEFKKILKGLPIVWHYIYIETKGLHTNVKRRENTIEPSAFDIMQTALEWPTCEEYDNFEIVENQ